MPLNVYLWRFSATSTFPFHKNISPTLIENDMNRNYLFTFLILFFALSTFSCGIDQKDKDAQELIEGYLTKELKEEDNYNPVRFTKIDTLYTTVMDNKEYAALYDKFNYYVSEQKENERIRDSYEGVKGALGKSSRNLHLNRAKAYLDSARMVKPELDAAAEAFRPEFKGWQMEHVYQTTAVLGDLVVNRVKFEFDKDLTKITDVEKLSAE